MHQNQLTLDAKFMYTKGHELRKARVFVVLAVGVAANTTYLCQRISFYTKKSYFSYKKAKKINESSSTSKDRLDSFGKFVAGTPRNQTQEISSTLMKEITNVIPSNFTIEINLPIDS